MSSKSTRFANQSQFSFIRTELTGSSKTSNNRWGLPQYIPFTESIKRSILNHGFKYPFLKYDLNDFKEPLRTTLRCFFSSLDAYEEMPHKFLNANSIFRRSIEEGPAFAKILKQIRTKASIIHMSGSFRCEPEWWKNVPDYRFKEDISEIFNYHYLFKWKEDTDDREYYNIPLNRNETGIYDLIKETLRKILPERSTFKEVDPMNILTKGSSSTSLNDEEENTSKFILSNTPDKELKFSSQFGIVKRCLIQTNPSTVRDTIITKLDSCNTCNLIEFQIQEILRYVRGYGIFSDQPQQEKKLRRMAKKFNFFLKIDFKKEGLTRPRFVVREILTALHELYPDLDAFKHPDFFDSIEIIDLDGSRFIPIRGAGLGMCVSLVTLMQILLCRICLDSALSDMEAIAGESKYYFNNDDGIVALESEEDMESYWLNFSIINQYFDLIISEEKSLTTVDGLIYCENYITKFNSVFNKKSHYKLNHIYQCFYSPNISIAKAQFRGGLSHFSDIADKYLNSIIKYWGYEFYPEESQNSILFGGWSEDSFEGVIKLPEFLSNEREAVRAYYACRQSYHKLTFFPKKLQRKEGRKRVWKAIQPIAVKLYEGDFQSIPDKEVRDRVLPGWEDLVRQHPKLDFWTVALDYFSEVYEERQNWFDKLQPILNYKDLIPSLKLDEEIDFIVPIRFQDDLEIFSEFVPRYQCPYLSNDNEIGSYLSFYNIRGKDRKIREKVRYNVYYPYNENRLRSSAEEKKNKKMFYRNTSSEREMYDLLDFYPVLNKDTDLEYHSPERVAIAFCYFYGSMYYPHNPRKKILDMKLDRFSRLLTVEEKICLSYFPKKWEEIRDKPFEDTQTLESYIEQFRDLESDNESDSEAQNENLEEDLYEEFFYFDDKPIEDVNELNTLYQLAISKLESLSKDDFSFEDLIQMTLSSGDSDNQLEIELRNLFQSILLNTEGDAFTSSLVKAETIIPLLVKLSRELNNKVLKMGYDLEEIIKISYHKYKHQMDIDLDDPFGFTDPEEGDESTAAFGDLFGEGIT